MPEKIPCDVYQTMKVDQLLETPREVRDSVWRTEFFNAVTTACFKCGEPQMSHGPDGFPYFELHLPEPEESFESYCIHNLMDYLLEIGYGVVLNPKGEDADWVFSYGDIVNLSLNQEIYSVPDHDPLPEYYATDEEEKVMIFQPSEEYLPGIVKKMLHSFLTYLHVKEPSMLAFIRSGGTENSGVTQLSFNIFPEDYGSEDEYLIRLKQLSWFLPRHYIITGVSRSNPITQYFEPL
ncbi:MAG: hypothetical protein KDC31_10765 [Saprospiraceae bacterium]|jgi:hypothetical protein|nr:hypothetical protein [Candidatus Parvibacillus calidus]MBX2936998.1 hypothetical protein [Saprospiraceae bacterium]MBX7180097.1 hypothetical protein [Saprospiraceae bacterium]MCB0591764.1 hypothetical protein [Saprospiraceae bacterium]MCO5282517.1 hypothetical protein [Saprospiraceae bacterium]